MNHVTRVIKHLARLVRTHRSTIMAAGEVGGLVGTFVLTVRANHKANERRHEAMAEKGENLTPWQIFIAEAPAYVVPFIVMLLTGGTIVANDILTVRQHRALVAASVGATKLLNDYKNSLSKEERERIAKELAEKSDAPVPEKPEGSNLVKFYDEWSKTFFWDTKEHVLLAEIDLNRKFAIAGEACYNDWVMYVDNPDLKQTESGWDLGWSLWMGPEVYGYSYIDVDHFLTKDEDGNDYYIISFPFPPTADYLDDPC